MFTCEVLTLFPCLIDTYVGESILGKAQEAGLIHIQAVDIRDFAENKHRTTDDQPYGGGGGMVMKPEPIYTAMDRLRLDGQVRRVLVPSPQGRVFTQSVAEELAGETRRLTIICGRYEGVDERVAAGLVDDEISLGDYVLTGGELAALAIIEACARLIPGVLGDDRSACVDSFSWGGILDYPHYTRPAAYRGMHVPQVLLSGNHREISRWRRKEALRRTLVRRPDLIRAAALNEEDSILISEIEKEDGRHEQNHRP